MPRLSSVLVGYALLAGCNASPDDASPDAPEPSGIYATHQCGGPRSWWAEQGAESGELVAHNQLAVGAADLRWNQVPIDRPTLTRYLVEIRRSHPRLVTVLVLAPEARCSVVESIRRTMDAALQCRAEPYCVEYAEDAWAKARPRVTTPAGS